jgi:type IV secretory pathway VirB6-like protein
MQNSTYLIAYLLTLVVCIAFSLLLIAILSKGLKKFFNQITRDEEISGFFTRLTTLVLFFGGLSAGVGASYDTGEKANWLTVTWDAAKQVKDSLQQLFIALLILSITFFILMAVDRKVNK